MNELRYGIVGVRNKGISSEHLHSILRLPGAHLSALCNSDADELAKAANEVPYPVKQYQDAKEMFEKEKLDAVVITTPNSIHKEIAMLAFAAGVHVLCEKPLAPTLAECDEITAASKKANRLLQVGLHRRYNMLYKKLQLLIERDELGIPIMMWSQEFRGDWAKNRFIDDPVEGKVNWRYSQKLSGGTLVEKNCHDFDVFNWFGGGLPSRVSAFGGLAAYEGRETLDHAIVNLEYPNGFKANLQLGLFVPHGFKGRYAGLVGDQGSVKIHEGTHEMYQYYRDRDDSVHFLDGQSKKPGHGEGVYAQHVAFLECIQQNKQPFADGTIGRDSIVVALAAEESIKIGKTIQING